MQLFDSARRAAFVADLLRPLRGRPADLLPFEAVREQLRLRSLVDRGVSEVPLDRIVGSLGRERDFNRAFLPRTEASRERWEGVRRAAEASRGFPPVELYKVGDAYFVVDGHHRVSVERALGAPSIEAHVQEFLTPVVVDADTALEDLLLRRGLDEFLEATGLVQETPDDFRVTEPDGYQRLLDHIGTHRWYLGLEREQPVPWADAVASWRRSVYEPMVATIRASGVLADFPGRSEADLYLFAMDHLHYLREQYAPGDVQPREALEDFQISQAPRRSAGDLTAGWRRFKAWIRTHLRLSRRRAGTAYTRRP